MSLASISSEKPSSSISTEEEFSYIAECNKKIEYSTRVHLTACTTQVRFDSTSQFHGIS